MRDLYFKVTILTSVCQMKNFAGASCMCHTFFLVNRNLILTFSPAHWSSYFLISCGTSLRCAYDT